MKIIRNKDVLNLAKQGADAVEEKILSLAKDNQYITLGLVGGRSVADIYASLSERKFSAWNKVHFFLADDRNVPKEDAESNYALVRKHLLDKLLKKELITVENIHRIKTELPPLDAKKEYEDDLENYGGIFDIAILSSGEDNHVAGIFPGKKYPENEKFTYFDDSPKPPPERFSATPALLSKTDTCIVIFTGEAKKEALKRFLDLDREKTTPEKTLRKIKNLIILTDILLE